MQQMQNVVQHVFKSHILNTTPQYMEKTVLQRHWSVQNSSESVARSPELERERRQEWPTSPELERERHR